jgi:hypothetical protein
MARAQRGPQPLAQDRTRKSPGEAGDDSNQQILKKFNDVLSVICVLAEKENAQPNANSGNHYCGARGGWRGGRGGSSGLPNRLEQNGHRRKENQQARQQAARASAQTSKKGKKGGKAPDSYPRKSQTVSMLNMLTKRALTNMLTKSAPICGWDP